MQIKRLAMIVVAAAMLATPAISAKKKAPTNVYERCLIYDKGDEGSKFYRIPAIATAPDGSLLAIADKRWNSNSDLPGDIDIVCRRSTDNGHTWSPAVTIAGEGTEEGYGDPAVVVDRKRKTVLCIMTHGNGLWESTKDDHAYIMVSHSADNGVSWTTPIDITDQLFGANCTNQATEQWIGAFATSGAATQLSDGRLMFALVVRDTEKKWDKLKVYACYSDDGGYHWTLASNSADSDADESKIIELNDGNLLMSIRNRRHGQRKFSVSTDRGQTWSEPWKQPDIIEPGCNGDIIRYKYGKTEMLLHTVPNDSADRKNVSIFASFDEGKTWPVKRSLCPERSAYSSICVLKDGTLGVFSEEAAEGGGWQLWFTRLSIDWLLKQ